MSVKQSQLRFALVAGEVSGDRLGAGLIHALREQYPHHRLEFLGVGGARMQAAGLKSLAPMEWLSVMGLIEPLRRLPRLLALRADLRRTFSTSKITAFIGIDAPDFNLGLARALREQGIPAVHYVGPQVWAWRQWRAEKIARSIDLMLTLFPFEIDFYQQRGIPACWVGHPLADSIPLTGDRAAHRSTLGVSRAGPLLALLPGSRGHEVARLAGCFAQAGKRFEDTIGVAQIRFAAADERRAEQLRALGIDERQMIVGKTAELLAGADIALAASGTVTLELLLHRVPMVVAYQIGPLSAWLARRLVKTPHFALPNLLAGAQLVPEYFQEQATPERLGDALIELWQDEPRRRELRERFLSIHTTLRRGASHRAAQAIADCVTPSQSVS